MPGANLLRRRRHQVALAVVGAGALLRLGQYLFNKSLWLDEAALGLQIMRQPFSAGLVPTGQLAPTGFIWAVKAVTTTIGDSELALRLVPLLFGIVSLWLFRLVVARYLEWPADVLALGLFAVSESLIYYSSELKQYSGDVAVALLLCLTMAGAPSARLSWRRAVTAGCVGALAVWLSHPSIFVLAGLGATALLAAWRARAPDRLPPLVVASACWGASVIACYLLTLRRVSAESDQVRDFWMWAFAPFPPTSVADLKWYPDMFMQFFQSPAGFALPGIAAFAFLAGGIWMFRERPVDGVLLLSPMLVVLLASALRVYPFSGRLILFLVPFALMFIAHGTVRLWAAIAPSSKIAAAAFVLLLTAPPVANAAYRLVWPRTQEELRPVLGQLRQQWKEGDRLYVYYGARPAFEYYASRYGLSDAVTSYGTASRDDWHRYFNELDTLQGPRVWIVFAHVYDWGDADEEKLFLFHLDRLGRRLHHIEGRRASAYLYSLNGAE